MGWVIGQTLREELATLLDCEVLEVLWRVTSREKHYFRGSWEITW